MSSDPLIQGKYYHIYTHAVGGRNLFKETANYEYFLHLYEKYIHPIADTYAWALMPNHVHFLIKLKENIAYKYSNVDGSIDPIKFNEIKWETVHLSACKASDSVKLPKPEKHLSHLFNSYAKYVNTKYNVWGSLFERPFKRKLIDNVTQLKRTIIYIHQNPIHHGFCDQILEYPWTSYLSCISIRPTKLNREELIGWFDDQANFKTKHNDIIELAGIDF